MKKPESEANMSEPTKPTVMDLVSEFAKAAANLKEAEDKLFEALQSRRPGFLPGSWGVQAVPSGDGSYTIQATYPTPADRSKPENSHLRVKNGIHPKENLSSVDRALFTLSLSSNPIVRAEDTGVISAYRFQIMHALHNRGLLRKVKDHGKGNWQLTQAGVDYAATLAKP